MHAINSFNIYYMNGKMMNELERATCSYTFILALYLDHSWLSFKTDNECTNGFIFILNKSITHPLDATIVVLL